MAPRATEGEGKSAGFRRFRRSSERLAGGPAADQGVRPTSARWDMRSSDAAPIAVAMSGGVDSSVVAAMLVRQGHNVVGMTMQLWNQRRLPELSNEGATGRCCSLDDVYDARRVAEQLGVPYYVVNFEQQF